MVVGKRGSLLALFVTCFLAQVLSQLPPKEPLVDCPVGYTNPRAWFFNQRTNQNWGSLCRAYATCATGFQQSPINIPTLAQTGRTPARLQLNLGSVGVNLIRQGDYVTMPVNTPNTLNWRGSSWALNRIEFHSPSEHTIQGKYANFEVQLYFNDASRTQTAAVAVLYNCGGVCDDAFFSRILPALPSRWRCQCGNNRTESYNPYGAEQCDEGPANGNTPNGCRANCQFPRCGDNVVDNKFGEECDTASVNVTAGQACRPNCILPYCGDGIIDTQLGERCDKGSWWEGSGCTGSCQPECGDACLQPGEECDYGIAGVKNFTVTNPLQHSNASLNVTGTICRMNCLWSGCGDSITDVFEECDEGDYNNATSTGGSNIRPNSCRENCTLPRCGDGVVDPMRSNVNATGTPRGGEHCEPRIHGAFCTSNCSWSCGNGIIEGAANETCDNGALNSNAPSNNTGTPLCRHWSHPFHFCRPATCGDGITDLNEDCDDIIETARCFRNCTYQCGNRIINNATEQCDNGHPGKFPARINDGNSDTRPNACRMNCQLFFCGDNVVDPLGCEQCDTGVNRSDSRPNACRTNCKNAWCGDGVVDNGEECDDRNNIDDDGCSCCRRDCGNGIKQGNEDCDDGAANSNTLADRCRLNCRRHFCGDGVVDSDEECDAGVNGSSTCTPSCTRTFCGDGVRQADQGEECDNGALNSYTALSGCSPVCTLNTCGQTLTSVTVNLNLLLPSVIGAFSYMGSETRPPCTQNVRWFVVQQPRTLTVAQCRAFQNIIPAASNRYLQGLYGRNPIVAPTTGVGLPPNDPRARQVCGDGIVQVGEECDNGRENDDMVPDACRTNCRANRCGDRVRDAGEECDGEAFCLPGCRIDRRSRVQRPPTAGACSGNRQSPIRLPEACPSARPLNLNHPSNVQYNPTPIVLFNTGNNILFPAMNGGSFSYKGMTYSLTHLEFHEPSEHLIGNRRFPFEVQLFHKSQNPGPTSHAVVSILFSEGTSPNQVLQPILDRLPPVSDCRCGNGIKEDIQAFPDGTWVREECDEGPNNNDRLPNRCRTNCKMAHCGDGVIDSKEQCDMGWWNAAKPNRCRPTCVLPFCGDGITDDLMGETCDDGNNVNGDGCNSNCHVECGDGTQGPNEECDLGAYNSNQKASGCRTTCKNPFCGDGILDIGEQCDNGAQNSNSAADACRTACVLPTCGDGVRDAGEQCDLGLQRNGNSTCSATCTLLCGNGVVDAALGEVCDNGPANSDTVPNACRTNCRRASCGDGVRDADEGCDTGAPNRHCQNCQVVCGNGILDAGEECDDGIYNSDSVPNACRTNCLLWSCGDGVFDMLEECDNGTNNANRSDTCRPWCRIPKCGDGIVDTGRGEMCDDGNILDGDGCDSSCRRECGNGRVDPGEVCDDGPRNSNSRPACCRLNCQLPRCGDSITDPGEECDDGVGNIAGPNTCRPDCTLPKCGDGIVDHLYGELCDQGGRNSLTVVDGCSPTCMPNLCRQSVWLNVTVNPGALLPSAPGTFHYPGSLTSGHCDENAEWFVFANPVAISSCQLAQFRRVISNNARCLQARNGRPVNFLEVTAKCGDGIVEGNEECDAGPANSDFAPNACRRNCRLPRCGDGVQDKGEQCDGTPNCSQTCTFSCATANTTGTVAGAAVGETNEINVNFAKILAN